MDPQEPQNEEWKDFLCSAYVSDGLHKDVRPSLLTRPPIAANERLAFPHPNSLKRAALLADRIYLPCWAKPYYLEDLPLELTFGDPQIDQQTAERTWMYAEIFWPWKLEDPRQKLDELLEIYLRGPLSDYRSAFSQVSIFPVNYDAGTPVVPVGNDHAYNGVLNHVPVVIEKDLSWQQVVEFRKDPEARRKYRDLHLWLEQSMNIPSQRHAADLISQKLDDYRWAIKKHGLNTLVESISSFVSLGAIVPPAGGLAAAAAGLSPLAGALAGGAIALAGATAWIGKRLLDLKDVKRGQHREVAYLYDIQKLAE